MAKLNNKLIFIGFLAAIFSCASYASSSVKTKVSITNYSTTSYYADDGSHKGPPTLYQQTMAQFTESAPSTDRQCWLGDTASATYNISVMKFDDPKLTKICVVTLHISYCDNFGSLSITKNSYYTVANESTSGDGCSANWSHKNNPGSLSITVASR